MSSSQFASSLEDQRPVSNARPVLLFFGAAFVVLLIHRWSVLDRPPFWDAAWSTSAGGVFLGRTGFDLGALVSQPSFQFLGPGTHSLSPVTWTNGLFNLVLGYERGLVASHVLAVVIGAALGAATFALARRHMRDVNAVLTATALLVLPLVMQQVSDPYHEVPLALIAVLSTAAMLDRRAWVVTVLVATGVLFKLTALALSPLVVLAVWGDGRPRRLARLVAMASVIGVPTVLRVDAARPSITVNPEPSVGGTLTNMRSAFAYFGLTADIVVILLLFVMVAWQMRSSDRRLVVGAASITVGFFAVMLGSIVVSQGITILPRYYVLLLPVWLVVIMATIEERHTGAATVLVTVLLGFSLVNSGGSFYPLRAHPSPLLAERSLAAQEYLDMEIANARALAAADVELLVVNRHMFFRLSYPELGFIEAPPNARIATIGNGPPALPKTFAWIVEPAESAVLDATMTRAAEAGGWQMTKRTIFEGTWTSHLIVARRPSTDPS